MRLRTTLSVTAGVAATTAAAIGLYRALTHNRRITKRRIKLGKQLGQEHLLVKLDRAFDAIDIQLGFDLVDEQDAAAMLDGIPIVVEAFCAEQGMLTEPEAELATILCSLSAQTARGLKRAA